LTSLSFTALGVAEPLARTLRANNYFSPTPIQTKAIPPLFAGRDVLGIAQTGTGKTAAFALPILQRLAERREPYAPRTARALILAPTRELACQIGDALRVYGQHLALRHAVVIGGVGIERQRRDLARGVDVVVATPGRLLDVLGSQWLRLDKVAFLVLDEADRMLDMGFIRDVRKIVAFLPKQRQSLLFSATMPAAVAHLAAEMLRDPLRIEVSPDRMTVEGVDQRVFFVGTELKPSLLARLLIDPQLARVIVFTRTKHGANRVAKRLGSEGVAAEAIHGNKSQSARQRALEKFRRGGARVLVATDVAARGIDIDGVTHVINYDLPNVPESYVHRIGRTARAGATGAAFSFCDPTERAYLRDIEKLTGNKLIVANDNADGAAKAARPATSDAGASQHRPSGHRTAWRSSGRPSRPGARRR
jgi:ATP-dependent RNA helicase RhlE